MSDIFISNARLNFCYLKIIRFLHSRYHPEIIGDILKMYKEQVYLLKVGLSPYKEKYFICFSESPLKMMKNAFCFILKALLLKIFKFLS